jgi:hypothetical protein
MSSTTASASSLLPVGELTHQRARDSLVYLVLEALAVATIWAATTLQLVAIASRAFAVYYLVQCIIASRTSATTTRKLLFLLLAVPLLFIALFAKPVG